MNGKMKTLFVLIVALSVTSLVLLASPAMASANGTVENDQDQTRLKTRDQTCDYNMLQTQERTRIRTQDQEGACNSNCELTQNIEGVQVLSQFGNCSVNMEQHKNQYRHNTNGGQ